ncbi:hypothetical protein [Lutibacter flavus]|uniref:Uncharacterized protein n=1 Tax=Lutibacter flavus TaxID=691689 RepID=A0A238VSH7_9FLAO|nr:hypothetical protein [Lutibacter flavus]SNR37186.1 hypothetical protein SAMN04488111_0971 [Lutibacter flavus]
MIIDLLNKSKNEQNIIRIWFYGEEEKFWFGYVKNVNEELFSLQHFTNYGSPDGILIEQIENIESIDFDNEFSKTMEYLIKHQNEIYKEPQIDLEITDEDNWQFEILDSQLGLKDRIITIQINGDKFYSGIIEWIDEGHLVLNKVGEAGQDEGKSIFIIDDINTIQINNLENRKRLMLYKWRKINK